MSDTTTELERLRADLEVFERYAERQPALHHECDRITREIARLEAEQADPWRELREILSEWNGALDNGKVIGKQACTAAAQLESLIETNERLAARVAELEASNAPIDPDGYQLGDFRVMKTAQEIARYAMDRNMDHPVTVKTARRAIWAIREFVEQARHWHGLSKLQPYRWTSLGRDDKNFIDRDFDTTESPCDYDPDAYKPLADMQPPFEGPIVGLEPVLDPARVLATAADVVDLLNMDGIGYLIRHQMRHLNPKAYPVRKNPDGSPQFQRKGAERGE